ncbi:uncharacterized protein LOC133305012 [Gastrolobium bilobum]|uniref:uncharacterized protein LOC133305012 n=1 Tax=Gastrolobium bilobum TaxID=150636 RepID=UPI002AB0A080|nr:uncharacterized protein LOC133305012 [Gastrolobium bilobum]
MVESGEAMLQTLDGMFATSSSSARQIALNAVTKTVMPGGIVQDHCLSMIANFKKAEDHRVTFEQEVKIDLLLQSLPDYFNQFKMNYNMNMLNLDLKLMHELESAEQSLVKQGSAFFVGESFGKPKGKPKGKKKNKKKKKSRIPVARPVAVK